MTFTIVAQVISLVLLGSALALSSKIKSANRDAETDGNAFHSVRSLRFVFVSAAVIQLILFGIQIYGFLLYAQEVTSAPVDTTRTLAQALMTKLSYPAFTLFLNLFLADFYAVRMGLCFRHIEFQDKVVIFSKLRGSGKGKIITLPFREIKKVTEDVRGVVIITQDGGKYFFSNRHLNWFSGSDELKKRLLEL